VVEEGDALGGGDVPEGVVAVVPKVELDPPQKDSGETERRGEKDTCVETEEPEVRDEALNADAAIRGNVELPPPLAEAITLSGKVCLTKNPTGDKEGDVRGKDDETKSSPLG
jgi:hypothetical protein